MFLDGGKKRGGGHGGERLRKGESERKTKSALSGWDFLLFFTDLESSFFFCSSCWFCCFFYIFFQSVNI